MSLPARLTGIVAACLALAALGPTESQADGTGRAATLAAACSGCHAGPAVGIVSLKDRDTASLISLLQRYKAEPDGGTVMHRLARGYSDAEVKAIAAYLAAEKGN